PTLPARLTGWSLPATARPATSSGRFRASRPCRSRRPASKKSISVTCVAAVPRQGRPRRRRTWPDGPSPHPMTQRSGDGLMVARLWWKALRQFWPIWALLALAGIVVQSFAVYYFRETIRSGELASLALGWTSLYAFLVSAAAFAGERESRTLR